MKYYIKYYYSIDSFISKENTNNRILDGFIIWTKHKNNMQYFSLKLARYILKIRKEKLNIFSICDIL